MCQTNRPWLKPLAIAAAAVVVIAIIIASVNGRGGKTGTGGSSASTTAAPTATPSAGNSGTNTSGITTGTSDNVPFAGLNDGVLAIGFDPEYPPYSYTNADGSYSGFDLELLQTGCDIMGIQMELVPINWDNKDTELMNGNIDCLMSVGNIDLIDAFPATEPYVDHTQVVVVNPVSKEYSTGRHIQNVQDLQFAVVDVLKDSPAETLVTKEWDTSAVANVYIMEDVDQMFQSLESHTSVTTAVITDRITALEYMERSGNPANLEILDETIPYDIHRICCLDSEVAVYIIQMLEAAEVQGTIYELGEKYGIDQK